MKNIKQININWIYKKRKKTVYIVYIKQDNIIDLFIQDNELFVNIDSGIVENAAVATIKTKKISSWDYTEKRAKCDVYCGKDKCIGNCK